MTRLWIALRGFSGRKQGRRRRRGGRARQSECRRCSVLPLTLPPIHHQQRCFALPAPSPPSAPRRSSNARSHPRLSSPAPGRKRSSRPSKPSSRLVASRRAFRPSLPFARSPAWLPPNRHPYQEGRKLSLVELTVWFFVFIQHRQQADPRLAHQAGRGRTCDPRFSPGLVEAAYEV